MFQCSNVQPFCFVDVDEIVDQVANMITQETKEKTLSQQWSRQFLE